MNKLCKISENVCMRFSQNKVRRCDPQMTKIHSFLLSFFLSCWFGLHSVFAQFIYSYQNEFTERYNKCNAFTVKWRKTQQWNIFLNQEFWLLYGPCHFPYILYHLAAMWHDMKENAFVEINLTFSVEKMRLGNNDVKCRIHDDGSTKVVYLSIKCTSIVLDVDVPWNVFYKKKIVFTMLFCGNAVDKLMLLLIRCIARNHTNYFNIYDYRMCMVTQQKYLIWALFWLELWTFTYWLLMQNNKSIVNRNTS